MKINKNKGLAALVLFIVLLSYSLILFLSADYERPGFWIGYSFTVTAVLFQIPTYILAFNNKKTLKNVFLGLPIETVGVMYLIVQFVLGLIIVYLPLFSTAHSILLSIAVLAAFLVLTVSSVFARDAILEVDEKTNQKTFYIKSLLADVEILSARIGDTVMRKQLKSLEDMIKYSDPMSHASLSPLENEITAKTAQLGEMISNGKIEEQKILVDEIEMLLAERNKKCKLLK